MAAAVPFALKAAPFLGKAATMIGGSFLGKKLSGASKDQKSAMAGQESAASAMDAYAKPMMAQGASFGKQGAGYLGQAGGYFSNILNNRRSAQQSLAPEMKTAMDYYSGASRKAGRTLQGGARDTAMAELDREKVGNMAMMLPKARGDAAAGAADVGSSLLGAGANASQTGMYGAANAANIRNGMFQNATTINNQESEGGKAWGSLLYDAAGSIFGGKKPPLVGSRVPGMTPPYAGPQLARG